MKYVISALLLLSVASVKAGPLEDQIRMTLIDHVSLASQIDARGTLRVCLLDSIIQIGKYNGNHILGIQGGFTGDTKPEKGQTSGINYVAGAILRLDPFFKSRVTLPSHWEFLKSLEFGPGYHYDFRTHEPYVNFQFGLAFDPAPKK